MAWALVMMPGPGAHWRPACYRQRPGAVDHRLAARPWHTSRVFEPNLGTGLLRSP